MSIVNKETTNFSVRHQIHARKYFNVDCYYGQAFFLLEPCKLKAAVIQLFLLVR